MRAVSRAADYTLMTMKMVVRVAETLKGSSAEPPTAPFTIRSSMLCSKWCWGQGCWCSRGWWVRRVSPGGLNLPPSSGFNGRRPHVSVVPSLHYHLFSTLIPIIFSIFTLTFPLQPFPFTFLFATWLFPSFIRFDVIDVNNQHFAVSHDPNSTFSYPLYNLKGPCQP